ncbi:MAG TPA: hypothetical protein QF753_12525 [Victivallales bacterium]|nr:hypothetical protein [Victivallales bacterium]
MPENKTISRKSYLSKNVGSFDDSIEINGVSYQKVEDLRYGTNPHQPAAYYKPVSVHSPIGDMEILKTGKSGLSQTNLEDISYALNIVKFFNIPSCAVMKHVNPSGAAVSRNNDSLKDVYIKARDCDPRAAFGSAVAFNVEVDSETAEEIMSNFVECVVAPSITDEALAIFNDSERFKLNKHIRILKCGDLNKLPKYVGDSNKSNQTIKVLADGSLIIAEPLLTNIKGIEDLSPATAENKAVGQQSSEICTTKGELEDLLAAWYINLNVRSNGVVIMKNGQTLAVGTGEQDRVGAVEQAIWKYEQKYEGKETIENSVMSSDGFFPFPDAVEVAAKAGVKAIISPAGSLKDATVIKRANELGVALVHAPERVFSHH